MKNEFTLENIKNRVYTSYSVINREYRIKELEECLKLCDELLEKERIEYDNLSYVLQFWYYLYSNNDTDKLKSIIEDCIIDEKLKPIW
jgi:hypothetical protein